MQARELPLVALRAFAVAARAPSLTAAATELGVTHGAISKQISSLESWLGQRMFRREGRRLALTPYGQVLAESLGQSINEIRGACEYVRRQKNQFVVSVEAPTTFAMYWLLPRLEEFHQRNPNVSVWTATRQTGENPDLAATDIVITRGVVPHLESRLRSTDMLFDERLTVISSPSLLARLPVKRPADVLRHRLITAATRPGEWEAWLNMVAIDHQILEGGARFDHLFVAMHAVRDSLGSIIAPENLFQASFAKKELSAPLPRVALRGASYFVHHTPRAEGKHVRNFTDWLHQIAASSRSNAAGVNKRSIYRIP
jgi:LysR family transcriptional regulator, glycine cleavage system transcriptional activator